MSEKHFTLVGAGIMSATLGMLLKELEPQAHITIFERLDHASGESSYAWNNAGTGHSANCELNYTPELHDGSIDISKATKICHQFEISKSFWAYLVRKGYFDDPECFINNVPHISFVWGDEEVTFLQKRYNALKENILFSDMQYSDDVEVLKKWIPLVMQGRLETMPTAATKVDTGTDLDYGKLTTVMLNHLQKLEGVELRLQHEVRDLQQQPDGKWRIHYKDLKNDEKGRLFTDFVFLGAGGGTLPLLEKSDIPEGRGYGGFPVGGQWLICNKEEVIAQHFAKVYGKPELGAPPMSMPHLDTRIINAKKELLFGPFAGFSTKFLKNGSYFDLPLSVKFDNFIPILGAGIHNVSLTKYLIEQLALSFEEKIEQLKYYYPLAKAEDWSLSMAGQRVQIIKKDKNDGGKLEFGTEVITSSDGTLAALLGASPGASTSVYIMIEVLQKCFRQSMTSSSWKHKLEEMIPILDESLSENPHEWVEERLSNNAILHLLDTPNV